MPASYTVSLVARTPVASGAPTLTELAGLVFDSISFTDELNKAGSATVAAPMRSMTETVKSRLRNLRANPCEVWVYRDSTLLWAGGVETVGIQGQNAQLGCMGLAGYLNRMGVVADRTFAAADQFAIFKSLIDQWQALPYGHYGLYTAPLAASSGTTRTIDYLAKDLPNVAAKAGELAAMAAGFDYWVEPSSRLVRAAAPRRGTDLTASVILDRRNIESASVAMSATAQDLVTYATGTATGQTTDGTSSAFFSTKSATNGALASFGATWAGQNFNDMKAQADVDGALQAFVDERDEVLFQPGVSISPLAGSQVGDFGVGDTLAYAYDAGLGFQEGQFRVSKRTVQVDSGGSEKMQVDFA